MTPHAAELLRPALEVLQSFGANAVQPSSYPPGADIATMSESGVPALGLMQDGRAYFNYHHTAADTLDKIVPAELRENAAAMAVMAYALASMAVSFRVTQYANQTGSAYSSIPAKAVHAVIPKSVFPAEIQARIGAWLRPQETTA